MEWLDGIPPSYRWLAIPGFVVLMAALYWNFFYQPYVEEMELLQDKGAEIAYSDPHIPVFPRIRRGRFDLRSVPITARSLARYDVVLIATNHDAFDYTLIAKHAKLIVDSRGVYRKPRRNVVKA